MKLVFIAGAVFIVSMGLLAYWPKQKPPLSSPNPIWDLGSIGLAELNKPLLHEFVIKNNREVSFDLDVKKSCGCIMTDPPSKVAALSSVPLKINFEPPRTPGPFRKDIIVLNPGDKSAAVLLHVTGSVEAESNFFTLPALVNFGAVKTGEIVERNIGLFNYDNQMLEMADFTDSNKLVTCQGEIAIPEFNRLRLKLHFSSMVPGVVTGYFTISLKSGSVLTVPYKASVKPQ